MKKINFVLLLLSSVFAFTACSKDDDDEADVPKPEMKYKQVKQIASNEGYGEIETTTFHYDDKGRIIEEIYASHNDKRFTYTYSDKQIVMQNDQYEDETTTFILGEDGRVAKIETESSYDGRTESTFSYSGGRIQKTLEKYPEDGFNSSESYFWNGNLTRSTYADDGANGEAVYEYGDLKYINNANIDLFYWIVDSYHIVEEALMLGIAGERSWYLPTKLTATDKEDGETETYTVRFSYVQDDEGYVTRITMSYDDEENPRVYEIIYND